MRPLYFKFIFIAIFFFTVFAAVDFFFFICQDKDVGKLLLNRSDTARVFTSEDIFDFFGERQREFPHDLTVFNDIDCDVVVNIAQDFQV